MRNRNIHSGDTSFIGGILFGGALGITLASIFSASTVPLTKDGFFASYQTLIVGIIAFLVSLAVAWQSHHTSTTQLAVARVQAQAVIFNERMAVFQTVKDFLGPWFRDGFPDNTGLWKLIDAWERSKFLFDQSVTDFLRQLWKDAVSAEYQEKIMRGEISGDYQLAVDMNHVLMTKYLLGSAEEPDILVDAFKSMKIVGL